jgi:hypothetical protein
MPLSWNEIRDRAVHFSREWSQEAAERAGAQTFWNEFFEVFGISRRRVAAFEAPVKQRRDGGKTATGYIDLLWKGQLLVEHKSRGKDLERAYAQAIDYFPGIPERDLPRYVLVSDFARFRLYDLELDQHWEFLLKDLHRQVRLFGFIAGYESRALRPQDPVNLKAAERMGRLHDRLKASGYHGHPLEVLLVRLLFCLFADDTAIFPPQSFREWIESATRDDGSDLGARLTELFQVLDTPPERRLKSRDETLLAFPYVNGRLFAEMLPISAFDAAMREDLLDACALDWGRISPAIFGGLFQSIMDPKARRNLGAHYTSEQNILKLIEPLFLDELRAEFERCKGNHNKLFELQKKLRTLTFLDPACGCGNFLVVAYRELRRLELDILRIVRDTHTRFLDIFGLVQVNVDQFFGIEIEEFPAQIAQVALWLTDHQMNQQVGEEFGQYFARLPLTTAPSIVHGNALTTDWRALIDPERLSFILGNPPFIGSKMMTPVQREELLALVPPGTKGAGVLDYVSGWYLKAAELINPLRDTSSEPLRRGSERATNEAAAHDASQQAIAQPGRFPVGDGSHIRAAFVSTNSITQGEQPGILWPLLWRHGMKIHFAHRTFQWNNEGRGKAAVHCVIVGFGAQPAQKPVIFDYEHVKGEPHAVAAGNINPYLVDAADLVLPSRGHPLCSDAPDVGIGNKPIDGGHYLFSDDEKAAFLAIEPQAAPWFRRWIGAHEFLNGYQRWCLWLGDCPPEQLRRMPECMKRVDAVRRLRLASKSAPTRALAATPTRFHVENIPGGNFLVIPKVSSERRAWIPLGHLGPETLASDLLFVAPHATPYHFGILHSTMHMAWVRSTCGRLKSDFRYSKDIVYNNYPWPDAPSDKQRSAIEAAAQAVLDARAAFPGSSLADLYDPLTMPPALVKAHQQLDRAVDAAYGFKGKTDAERVAFLFQRYQALTSLLPPEAGRPKRRACKPVSS